MNKCLLLLIFSIAIIISCGYENKKGKIYNSKTAQLDTLFNELFEQEKFNGNLMLSNI